MEIVNRAEAKIRGLKTYFTGKPCKYGHIAERQTSSGSCCPCSYKKYLAWRASPKGAASQKIATARWKDRNKDRIKAARVIWEKNNQGKLRYLQLRSAAKTRGTEFNLEESDLVYPEYCPALGIKLNYGKKKANGPQPDSPSVDRIDPTKGYVKGNVVVVSQLANAIKTDATAEQVLAVGNFYAKLTSTR